MWVHILDVIPHIVYIRRVDYITKYRGYILLHLFTKYRGYNPSLKYEKYWKIIVRNYKIYWIKLVQKCFFWTQRSLQFISQNFWIQKIKDNFLLKEREDQTLSLQLKFIFSVNTWCASIFYLLPWTLNCLRQNLNSTVYLEFYSLPWILQFTLNFKVNLNSIVYLKLYIWSFLCSLSLNVQFSLNSTVYLKLYILS